MSTQKQVMVIGGGAAGFFAAINLAQRGLGHQITLVEKSQKLLSKVSVSGGGRCNVTHNCFDAAELVKHYPRGGRELRQVFARFGVQDTIRWFADQGVALKTEEDGRMFPRSDSSETIVQCFLHLARKYSIRILTGCGVTKIERSGAGFILHTNQGLLPADAVICASGGHHKPEAYQYLETLGHRIVPPIPSLFTINLPGERVQKELQGIAVPQAEVSIEGSKLRYSGPVLVTHWGLSGPAVLKLSAFAASVFHAANYQASILVNWVHPLDQNGVSAALRLLQQEKLRALPWSQPLAGLPRRLWEYLCREAGIDNSRTWAETGSRQLNALAQLLCRSRFAMQGKTTFKEEFVTCGGVNLKEVDFRRMESKLVPGLYFCGEVLDIDGVTGGFNFQNAWSTAWICANSMAG